MKRLVMLAFVALFIASCATQSDQARTEGTLIGAGVGAAIGAGLGYAIGGSGKSAGIGAAIGALAGGAGGYVYADHIAKRHEELAGKENDLDARIAFARGVNEDTEDYNKRLKKEVDELEPRITEVAAKKKKQEITQSELKNEKQALATKIKDANTQLAVGQDQLRDLKKFRTEQKETSKELDEEIATLEKSLAQMKSNTSALASLNQRI
jgi:hypothetical protein